MKSSLMGLISLLWVAALPVEAFAQDRTGRARNQPLQEQLKPLDVFTTQSVPTAESPKHPGSILARTPAAWSASTPLGG